MPRVLTILSVLLLLACFALTGAADVSGNSRDTSTDTISSQPGHFLAEGLARTPHASLAHNIRKTQNTAVPAVLLRLPERTLLTSCGPRFFVGSLEPPPPILSVNTPLLN